MVTRTSGDGHGSPQGGRATLHPPRVPRAGDCDVLVLDGRCRQALATVRSLGSRAVRVAVLETDERAPAFASRWCAQRCVSPVKEGSAAYLAAVEQAIEQTGAHIVIPCTDASISLLRQYRDRLEPRVRVAMATESALQIAVDKERTLEVAKKLGIAVPRGVKVTSSHEIAAALREVGLPAVLKPVESWVVDPEQPENSQRLVPLLVSSLDEAHAALDTLLGIPGSSVLVQQFLPGARESMSFMYAQGTFHARFAHAVLRTNPPLGGTDVYRRSIPIPLDIGRQSEQLVREMNLEGYSLVEFRRDSAGRPYLMEVNPRLSAGIELAIACGVDFPRLLYQWANGEPIDTVSGYRVNCHMRYLSQAIAVTAISVVQAGKPGVAPPPSAVLGFCGAFFIPAKYDYLNWRDLRPVGKAMQGWFRQLPVLITNAHAMMGGAHVGNH